MIVDAYGTSPENADRQVRLAEKLVVLARKHKIRLIFSSSVPEVLKLVRISIYLLMILKKMPGAETWINTPRQQLKRITVS